MMASKPIFDDVKEWPSPQPAPAHLGHNRPPLEELIPEEFRAELLRERPEFLQKLADLVDAANRAKAEDDETLGRCGDLVKSYRALKSHIEAVHKDVKQPYLDGGRLVDAEKNGLVAQVEDAKRRVEVIGNAFVAEREAKARAARAQAEAEQRAAAEASARAEREREEAEQRAEHAALQAASAEERAAANAEADAAAERARAAMAAAALAPAIPERSEPVRSDAGAAVSSKQEWRCEVTDYEVAFMAVEDNPRVREAIDKAIAGLVRAGKRQIAGCRVWPVAKANFT